MTSPLLRRCLRHLLGMALLAGFLGLGPPVAAATTTVGGERLASSGLVVDAPGAEALPEVGAAAWLLADLDSGDVLAARDPHGRYRPASTMKILTALTLLPELDPDATYVAQQQDANAEGSKVGLVPGATYTVHNLYEALFLVSGNDAALALANAAGGLDSTVARMNAVARRLGALDTRAANPSGLDAPGQRTSAYDLAVVSRAAMARPDFRAYARTVTSRFPGTMPRRDRPRRSFEIYTQDRLLLTYRGALGIKNGWTTKARGTFVGAATRGGRTLVATVLHTEGEGWREAAALLSWGFRNASVARPVGTLDALPAAASEQLRQQAGPGPGEAGEVAGPVAGQSLSTDSGAGLPWWVQAPAVLLAVVLVLRARVLLRQRLRHRQWVRHQQGVRHRERLRHGQRHDPRRRSLEQRAPMPQPRERRRAASVATRAPIPAPASAPATAPPRLPARPPDAGDGQLPRTSAASTGTAS